ncbi:MAG TPA: cellulose binding domain-containing protein, partial [Ktedonobacteraceae bacterium]|nr:cellulose binding domain-containing protein [Ktedonobacteraceae bacterium]
KRKYPLRRSKEALMRKITILFGRLSCRHLVVLVVLLPVLSLLALSATFAHAAPNGLVGPKQYYLALGDSLAYGLQPDGDTTHGYVDDIFQGLQSLGTQSLENLGCPGATTTSFINGSCGLSHVPYSGSQLSAAVAFLTQHAGQVSPVTIDIGGNDTIGSLCTTDPSQFATILNTLDTNLRQTILPQLRQALTVNGVVTGDLVLMNYYDPYHDRCSASITNTETFDQHLANDASGYATVVDVFSAFGGPNTTHTCDYTWMCSQYMDIHATTLGYQVMAQAFFSTTGYTGMTPTPTPTRGVTPTPTQGITPTPTRGITPTPTQGSGSGCRVHYAITGQWPGGFGADITITNTGTTAWNGWTLTFSFANGQTITQLWNGTVSQSGSSVTVTNVSYNGSVAAGASVSPDPGFNGTWNGTNNAPTAFTLNGMACSVA